MPTSTQIKQAITDAKSVDIEIIESWLRKTEDPLIQSLLTRIINEIRSTMPVDVDPGRDGTGGT